jgi:hypothetical protein
VTSDLKASDEMGNNLLATGGIHMALMMSAGYGKAMTSVATVGDLYGNATNVIEVTFNYLNSPYRLTVERVELPSS